MAKFSFKALGSKFQKMPTWGKVLVAGGAGLGIYALTRKKGQSGSANEISESDGLVYYPYTDYTGDFAYADGVWDSAGGGSNGYWGNGETVSGGDSGSGSSSSGYITNEQFAEWNKGITGSLSDLRGDMDRLSAGNNGQEVPFNEGYQILQGQEGINSYLTKVYADGTKEVYKNGNLVPEENYQYIPMEYGGTRKTGSGLGYGTMTSSQTRDPNVALQQAQEAYGAAKTAAERQKAAAAGEAARKAGATDAGAQAVWQSTKKSSSSSKKGSYSSNRSNSGSGSSSSSQSSVSAADRALQKAQADYGAAKTDAQRKAAAAAGEAARKAGATDAGAQKVWKSL